jgi:hypothetical protein
MVAVEKLAGYMATIEAAVESMQETKEAARAAQATRATQLCDEACQNHNILAMERYDYGNDNRSDDNVIPKGSVDVVNHDAHVGVHQRPYITEPSNKASTRRDTKELVAYELNKVPSVIEFPTFQQDEKCVMAGGVMTQLHIFCADVSLGHPFQS